MALAMSSLPVPLSPWMRTVERLGATWATSVEEAQHGVALADDVLEVVALLERALELDDLFFGAVAGDGGADVGEQLLVVPGLLDEVLGAGADGVHHVADRAVGGDHDDGKLGLQLLDARQQVDAALAGQREVEQQQVVLVAGELFEAGAAVGGEVDGEAFQGEQRLERFADGGLVVDDEDADVVGDAHGTLRLVQEILPGGQRSQWSRSIRGAHGSQSFRHEWASFVRMLPRGARRFAEGSREAEAAGKSRMKMVPTPTSLSTWILPACSWMMP